MIAPRPSFWLALAFFATSSVPLVAQAPLEPARMPAHTSFYVLSRGTPPPDARKANTLFALWDDPQFVTLRSGIVDTLNSANNNKSRRNLSPAQFEEYATLLENPFVIGYIGKPELHQTPGSAPATPASQTEWNGFFLVYDRTGKEALLSKAILALRAQEKEVPQISQFALGDVQVLKVQRKTGTTFWVENGKYAVSANERSVLEEILSRLNGKSPAKDSLAETSAYREAKPLLGTGVLEFFARVPRLRDLTPDAGSAGFQLQPLFDALKLDAVHSFSGHVTLDGVKTHVQAALLGDASPHTLFDLWSEGQTAATSLSFLTPETVSYHQADINLAGFYGTLNRALRASLPAAQQGNADMLDILAQTKLGMPLPEALGLLTGEFSSLQNSPALDSAKQIYFVGIRKKPETLKLFRTLLGEQIASERSEGDTTYLKISLGGGQSSSGTAQWNFYHAAVTPTAIFAAGSNETLHTFLANHKNSSSGVTTSAPAKFQADRSRYPAKLNGLSFLDFQQLDWQAVKANWIAAAKAAAGKQKTLNNGNDPTDTVPDWLLNANPRVFARHLHFTSAASWKDAKGVHFEGWLE